MKSSFYEVNEEDEIHVANQDMSINDMELEPTFVHVATPNSNNNLSFESEEVNPLQVLANS